MVISVFRSVVGIDGLVIIPVLIDRQFDIVFNKGYGSLPQDSPL